MKYYILKLYQEEKEKRGDIEQGLKKYELKVRRKIIICLIVIFLATTDVIITSLFSNQLLCSIGVVCFVALFILFWIDNKYEKEHMDKYVDSYRKKLDILDCVLSKFHINTKEKIEELIYIYQIYVDKEMQNEKKRNRIILIILSAFAGLLTISFENMGKMGLDFSSWLCLAAILLTFVVVACIWIYVYKYFDALKWKYEIMIENLKGLLMIKY